MLASFVSTCFCNKDGMVKIYHRQLWIGCNSCWHVDDALAVRLYCWSVLRRGDSVHSKNARGVYYSYKGTYSHSIGLNYVLSSAK
jgi:hypothetical protein